MNWEDSVGPRSLPKVSQRDLLDAITRAFLRSDFGEVQTPFDLPFGRRDERRDRARAKAERVMSDLLESRPERFDNWEGVLYSTIEVLLALREQLDGLARETPGFQFTAVGFLDPEFEPNAFGVALFSAQAAISGEIPVSRTLRLNDGRIKGDVPIVVRPFVRIPNVLPTQHMTLGTAACWARSRVSSNSPVGPGVLTAEHVVGSVIGAPVSFGAHFGQVLDVAPLGGIDAALVSSPETPNLGPPLRTRKLVAPWTDVQFSGMMTKQPPVQTKVTMTTDMLGILNSPRFPVKLILAGHGQSGDSGALVRELKGFNVGDGVGIYTDLFTNAAGQTGGIAQHLHQVVEVMDMELYG